MLNATWCLHKCTLLIIKHIYDVKTISYHILYHEQSELRTQTFIYLTNNVYNYIKIVKKIINKPGQETTTKTNSLPLASKVATQEKL